ncbi:endonuclease/exonuclease/phosphatase family protein [Deinococcus sp. UR1]|uniref:endonuclease/exonuclease/phosphatase family protein n=1 Tax=Deinococcus sp. UR1 TaxID=1704277 RepID=UPI001F536920|nr:endonuclease/exonuclease/phosphatase family protein [Deinococcus sp. UR1]
MKFAWMTLLLVCLTWALGEWPAERTLPTLLLAYAPPLLWVLATLPALAWALWRRRGRRVALAALLLAVWGAGLLHWTPQQKGTLRVVTFNVLGGARTTPDELAGRLQSLKADVLLLQESRFVQPDFRAAFLNALPGYAVAEAGEVMTLTRLPLLGSRTEALPGNRRELLVTRLEWRGEPLTVVNAHLGTVQVSSVLTGDLGRVRRTRDARAGQVQLLRAVAAGAPGRVLLGGDLNTPPRGQVYRDLRAAFGPDAHDLAGRGPGWTFPSLRLRIDHLMGRGLSPARAQVLPWALSDHRPLLAEYRRTPAD